MKTAMSFFLAGLLLFQSPLDKKEESMNLQKKRSEAQTVQVEVCSDSSTKTYMDYRRINDSSSPQAIYIKDNMTVDETTGLLYDKDGFIGVALGSYFGEIGTRFYFTLDTGVILPLVKVEEKSDRHTVNGCRHRRDDSVIELVIDTEIVRQYYKDKNISAIYTGNFNDDERFKGNIVSVEIVEKTAGSKKRLKEGMGETIPFLLSFRYN